MNNTSTASIKVENADQSMAAVVRSSVKSNRAIVHFLNYFGNNDDHTGIELRNYIASSADPIVGLAAYKDVLSGDKKLSIADKQLYMQLYERLEVHYPDLKYTKELKTILGLGQPIVFGILPVLVLLGAIIMLLIILWYVIRKKQKPSLQSTSPEQEKMYTLTHRERTILELILKGHTNKELADQLNIEVTTIKAHVRSIFQKLDIKSRKEVFRFSYLLEKTTSRS